MCFQNHKFVLFPSHCFNDVSCLWVIETAVVLFVLCLEGELIKEVVFKVHYFKLMSDIWQFLLQLGSNHPDKQNNYKWFVIVNLPQRTVVKALNKAQLQKIPISV